MSDNVDIKTNGNKLTIEIDLKKDCGLSKSGKNTVVATTRGNIRLEGGITLGLNVYKPV